MKRYSLVKDIRVSITGRFENNEEALEAADKICNDCFNDNFVDSIRSANNCSLSVQSEDWEIDAKEIITKDYVLARLKEYNFEEIIPNLYRGIIQKHDEEEPEWILNKTYFVFLDRNKGYYWQESSNPSYLDTEDKDHKKKSASAVNIFRIED